MIADEVNAKAVKIDQVARFIGDYEMASGVGSWSLREFIAFSLVTCNKGTPTNSLESANRCIERLARELVNYYTLTDR